MTATSLAPQDKPSGQSSDYTITRIETVAVVAPLAREFRGSYYRMTHRATLIVRVHSASGLIGEAYVGDEHDTLRDIEQIVHREVAPVLLGRDATAIEQCWAAAYAVTFDILRDRRLGLVALAGVDTALWDLTGKVARMPLWKLWGGYRDWVPLVAIGGYYGEPLGSIEDEVAQYVEMGLGGMKFKVGGATPRQDAERVERARAAAPKGFYLSIDANQGYTVPDAVELSRRLAALDIAWFEEPVQWHNDRRSLRDVRYRGPLPVCAGQSEFSASGCRALMDAGAIDVCNFDASWSGGPTAWRRAAAVAATHDVRMGHHEEPQVSSHLLASQPHGTVAECFHPDRDPFWWNMIANPPELRNGKIHLTDRPGLGWDLNWDYIDQYRLPDLSDTS